MNDFYTFNPDGQGTLAEIQLYFHDYDIHVKDDILVVERNGKVYVTFKLLDDNDGTPDVYQLQGGV
jgi:hypothetical protein